MDRYLENLAELKDQGFCNKIYTTIVDDRVFIIKELNNQEVDHKIEIKLQNRASKLKIAPKIVKANQRYIISDFVEGIHKKSVTNKEIKKLAKVLKKFHKIRIRTKKIDLKKLLPKSGYYLLSQTKRFKKEIALCHNDLNKKNIIFSDKIYLLDFEYSMYGDIYFDLASLSVEFNFNQKQERVFMQFYFKYKEYNLKKLKLFKKIYYEAIQEWFKNFRYNSTKTGDNICLKK